MNDKKHEIPKNEDEWREKLSPEQYEIMRERGTEAPFSGRYVHEKKSGTYKCAACGQPLFSSGAKFDSGTGWPSFDQALPEAVRYEPDISHGMDPVRGRGYGKLLGFESKNFKGIGKNNFQKKENDRDLPLIGMERTEVLCTRCGSHLGHVFNDGPTDPSIGSGQATGRRHCINSVCLELEGDGA